MFGHQKSAHLIVCFAFALFVFNVKVLRKQVWTSEKFVQYSCSHLIVCFAFALFVFNKYLQVMVGYAFLELKVLGTNQ